MKKQHTYTILITFTLLIISFFSGCKGALYVERTKDFRANKTTITKLVTITPDFELLTTSGSRKAKRQFKRADVKEDKLIDVLIRNAEKNQLELEIIDTDRIQTSDTSFFEEIAPLKREILQASYMQKFMTRGTEKTKKQVFSRYEKGPEIASHFSYLAKKHGTPYFAIQGITTHRKPRKGKWLWLLTAPPLGITSFFSPEVDTYYYTIVADVQAAQIVYREIRKVDAPATGNNLNSIVFDSFNILTK